MRELLNSSKWRRILALGLILVALCVLVPQIPAAGQEERSREELRAVLQPIYVQLLTDPQFRALAATLPGNMDKPAVVDRYLTYLPLSPKEMLELDMERRHYEIMMPPHIEEWHHRWMELRPDKAREHYGDDALSARQGDDVWMDEEVSVDDALAQLKVATVGTNRNAAAASAQAPTAYQGEIQVVVNPNNPNQLVAAANTWNAIPGVCTNQQTQAIFFSGNGGVTWNYTCAPGSAAYAGMTCGGFVFGSDPALFWNSNNEVFLNYMLLCDLGGNDIRFAMVVARSANGGATWNGQGIVRNSWPVVNRVEDKNFYAIDTHTTSPFFNRHYTCWDRDNNEKMAFSTNNGATWTEVDLPTTPSSGAGTAFDLACELEVQKNGTVHVVYDTLRCTANCNNEQMFYSRSVNGGVGWSAPTLVQDFNLVGFSGANCPQAQNQRCANPFGALGVDNSTSSCAGTLYAAYTDFAAGGVETSDIFVRRSLDNGVTWQAPVRVNDDGAGGRIQFHPFLQVDPSNGDVVLAWHDARNDPANRAVQIFATRSTNCGQTFEPNVQVSQASTEFNNSTISTSNENSASNVGFNPNQYGEYLGLSVHNQRAHVAWTDTRHYFPAFTTNPQRENVGYANVQWDNCPLSTTSGSFNQSVGATPGSILGAVNNPASTQILTLAGTVTTGGALTGVLRHPVHNTVYYNVSGTWAITAPPSQGTFRANITELGSGAIAGVIGGTWTDNAAIGVVGTYAGTWRVCPLVRTDAWSRDLTSDTGVEPNPVASPMWTSPDIWVRNQDDGGTAHQNPEAGQTNYIHVNIRNRSLVDAVNVPVKFYFANASTGLSWPTQWTQIGQATLALVPGNPTAVVVAKVPWSIPTSMTGHFCLVVRIDTPQDPMRFAEGTNISLNTQNNNNIVWRNVNIVNLIPGRLGGPSLTGRAAGGPAQTVEFIFRNVEESDVKLNLVFQQDKDETGTVGGFLERGAITVELTPEMAEIWAAHGNQGRGIRRIDGQTFMVVEDGGFIYVPLQGKQEFPVKVTFEDTQGAVEKAAKATLRAAPRFYTVSAIQENASDPKIPIGGVTYQIYTADGGPPEN